MSYYRTLQMVRRYAPRPNRRRQEKDRQAWMAALSRKVEELGGHPEKIDWATARYIYDYGRDTNIDRAAKRMVEIQEKE